MRARLRIRRKTAPVFFSRRFLFALIPRRSLRVNCCAQLPAAVRMPRLMGRRIDLFQSRPSHLKRSAVWNLWQADFHLATFLASSASLLRPKKTKKVCHGRKKWADLSRMDW
jgi:hypothetical protein